MCHEETHREEKLAKSSKIVDLIKSPIKFFALIALVCNTIFSIAAAIIKDPQVFIYCIHMFLVIVGLLVVIALWSPRSLYHPQELKGIDPKELPPDRPWIPTIVAMVVLLVYVLNHYILARLGIWPVHSNP